MTPKAKTLCAIAHCFILGTLVVISVSGCATTISRSSQATSIDSTPRGLSVRVNSEKDERVTPFFISLPREHHHLVTAQTPIRHNLKTAPKDESSEVKISCEYAWVRSPLENFLFGAIAGSLSGGLGFGVAWSASLLIDGLSGASFNCPHAVHLYHRGPTVNSCLKMFLMIPSDFDHGAQLLLGEVWRDHIKERGVCVELVDRPTAFAIARTLDIDFLDLEALRHRREQTNRFGLLTGVDEVILLSFEDESSSESSSGDSSGDSPVYSTLNYRVLDLHTLNLGESRSLPLPLGFITPEDGVGQSIISIMRDNISLLPNTIGFANNFREMTDTDGDSSANFKSFSAKISNISHPIAFDRWDLDLNLDLNLGIDFLQRSLLETPNDTRGYRYNRLSLYSAGHVAAHTPLGAISFNVGIGLGYYKLFDLAGAQDELVIGQDLIVEVHYTAFITRALFLRVYVQSVLTPKVIQDRYFKTIDDRGLMIGYYFHDLERWTREVF